MKTLAYLFILVSLIFTSCSKDPYADFVMSSTNADVGQIVYFTNRSANTDGVDWDFGDGYFSTNFNASHDYSAPGIYTVTLTAYGKNGRKDIASSTIRINEIAPYSDFIMSTSKANVGEAIIFTNNSLNAVNVDWDFGDGSYSTNLNPSHVYSVPGDYTVTLTAYGRSGLKDVASSTIHINDFAELQIEVVEYYDEYIVPNASVRLYPTVKDWEDETNMVVEGFTNNNGKVIFTGLFADRRYYVDVWEENHDNLQLAAEDAGFIETQVLEEGRNSFIAYVDYYEPAKKSATSRKKSRSVGTKKAGDGGTLRIRSEKMR